MTATERMGKTKEEMVNKIHNTLKTSVSTDMGIATKYNDIVDALTKLKVRMNNIDVNHATMNADLQSIIGDFQSIPRVRDELLGETQPIDNTIFSDHFKVNQDGEFVFYKNRFGSTIEEGFIGAINTDNFTTKCTDASFQQVHTEMCAFCSNTSTRTLCDHTKPYFYWVNTDPFKSRLYSSFEEQCLNTDGTVMNKCQVVGSNLDPKARLLRVFMLFKSIVDSMTGAMLRDVFNVEDHSRYTLTLLDKMPATILYNGTTHVLGRSYKDMPFAKMLVIMAIILKGQGKSLPYLDLYTANESWLPSMKNNPYPPAQEDRNLLPPATTQPPPPTTTQPPATTQPPTTTPPPATTQPPPTTTQPPPATTQPPPATTQPPPATTQPPMSIQPVTTT